MCANFSFTGQKCLDPSFNQSCRTEKQSIIVSFFLIFKFFIYFNNCHIFKSGQNSADWVVGGTVSLFKK